jgi:hypothetical protein
VTDPEQLRRTFLQASLQRELQRATVEQERGVIGRLGGKRGRQLVRCLPTVEVVRVYETAHWVDVTHSIVRCWYDLAFATAVGEAWDSRTVRQSKGWGDQAAWTFASAYAGMVAARLEARLVAVAAPAAELAIPTAVALLQREASRMFCALRSEIPTLAGYETKHALVDAGADLGEPDDQGQQSNRS